MEHCEWKPLGTYGWLIMSPHEVREVRNRDDLQNRQYCGVCGKKIKIKERE